MIGVISVFNSTSGTFSAEDEASLARASNVLGLALRNSILYEAVVDRQEGGLDAAGGGRVALGHARASSS